MKIQSEIENTCDGGITKAPNVDKMLESLLMAFGIEH
jgi:hypothetical protein